MAANAFLRIEGDTQSTPAVPAIDGSCTDAAHVGWIEVIRYEHGLQQPITGASASGSVLNPEKADHLPFTINKPIDKSTPPIADACANAPVEGIGTVTLQIVDPTTGTKMEYVLENCHIASVAPRLEENGWYEVVKFIYTKISWKYYEAGSTSPIDRFSSLT